MDYALLAATVLGAVSLYLMLPRQRASLVKLGALVGVFALGLLLLYLLRDLTTNASIAAVDPYFYVFAIIMILGAVGVVCQSRPVYAALYFVLVTLAGAGLFVLLLAEFMAIVLIIIYAGAILVTYVFVIMLASQSQQGTGQQSQASLYDREAAEPFVAVLVSFVLLGAVLQVLFPTANPALARPQHPDPMMVSHIQNATAGTEAPSDLPGRQPGSAPAASEPTTRPVFAMSNVQLLGNTLYGNYALSLELAGILLTIALIGAVVIARKETHESALGTGQVPNE